MTNQVIPDAAVEAAAKTLAVLNSDAGDQLSDHEWARAILEAAAPHMLAAYLLGLAADVRARGDIGKDGGLESWDYLAWHAEKVGPTP